MSGTAARGRNVDNTKHKRRVDLLKQSLRLLGLLLFVLILTRVDLSSLGRTLSQVDPILLLLSIPFFIPAFMIKSVRWGIILQEQGCNTSLRDRFLFNLAGFYVGAITPGRLGEFVRVLYLREQRIPTVTALFSVFLERVLDMLVIGAVSLLAIPLVLPQIGLGVAAPVALTAVLTACLFLWLITRLACSERILGWTRRLLPESVGERITGWMHDFKQTIAELTFQTTLVAVFLTLLSIVVMYTQLYLLILALHIELSFLYMSGMTAAAQLIALLPVTISGIGTRDAVFIYAFRNFGLAPEQAIAFSIMVLFGYMLNALFGLGAWLIRPIHYRSAYPRPE
jgi:uncharacterized protein (TIRG00374 family)